MKISIRSMAKQFPLAAVAALAAALVIGVPLYTATLSAAAPPPKAELDADTIEYDSTQGVVTAEGHVRLARDKAVLTGSAGEYNVKTGVGTVSGGVRLTNEGAEMTAAIARALGGDLFEAEGNVVLTKEATKITGPRAKYDAGRQYAIMTGGATLSDPDGTLTADQVEAFFDEDRAVATGNVHIVSPPRKLDAVSDTAVYYMKRPSDPARRERMVLTGHASVVQDNNVVTGDRVTVYLDDKAMNASGQSKLVVKPAPAPAPAPAPSKAGH